MKGPPPGVARLDKLIQFNFMPISISHFRKVVVSKDGPVAINHPFASGPTEPMGGSFTWRNSSMNSAK